MSGTFGIHVGNSSACLAFCKDGKADVIADDAGDRVMPAIVAFIDGEEIVGLPAKAGLLRNTASTVIQNKKLINDQISEAELQDHLKKIKCRVVTEGNLRYEIKDDDNDLNVQVTPEHVATCIYNKLHAIASSHIHTDTELRTVLCVPLHFSQASRQILARAAEDAGFDVLQVISEPAAALFCHAFGMDMQETGHCLVYRLGGVTLDVTVMFCCAGMYTVKSTIHRYDIGGNKFTEILADFLAGEFQHKWKLDPRESRRSMLKLSNSAALCKHILSSMGTAHCFIESLCEGIDFSYNITRARFESLITSTIKLYTEPITEALELANLSFKEVDRILLCGGSAKIPKLQQVIGDLFPEAAILGGINPDELIALGAAKHGNHLTEPFDPDCEHLSFEITVVTKPVYLKLHDELVCIVPSQVAVPVKRKKTFTEENHPEVTVYVIERDNIGDHSTILGKMSLKGLSLPAEIICELSINSVGGLHGVLSASGTQEKSILKLDAPENV